MDKRKNILWKRIRWILFGCVPLFFFIRGVHLILTGGGWIATTDQPIHWVLLSLEILIAALAACGCFYVWYKESFSSEKKFLRRKILMKAIAIAIIFTFGIHFIRVGFWLQNSVL